MEPSFPPRLQEASDVLLSIDVLTQPNGVILLQHNRGERTHEQCIVVLSVPAWRELAQLFRQRYPEES